MSSDTFSFPDEDDDQEETEPAGSTQTTQTAAEPESSEPISLSSGTSTQQTTSEPSPDESGRTLLEARDLKVSYGKVDALKGIDLRVDEGEVVSLIGPNGAGKSTFANTATGFLDYEGTVEYKGRQVAGHQVNELVENGLVQCTEKRDLFGYMSVDDNLRLGAYVRDDDHAVEEQLEFVYDLFPRLKEREDQHARTMSGGEQQMLAVGRSLMGDPDLLVLDEPTIGLAPVILEDISRGLQTMVEEGVTVMLCEQNVTFAMKHADRIYLLENGTIEREGTPDSLRGDDYIQEAYLGG